MKRPEAASLSLRASTTVHQKLSDPYSWVRSAPVRTATPPHPFSPTRTRIAGVFA